MRHKLALLLAIFWFAQVQGVVHEIGHLASANQAQEGLAAPHASPCLECLALAQAGAAPVSTPPAPHLPIGTHAGYAADAAVRAGAPALLGYRSRAPPLSSI